MKKLQENIIDRFVVKTTLPIQKILYIQMKHSENDHGKLRMEVIIEEDEKEGWQENSYLGERIHIYEIKEQQIPIFLGQINTICWKKRNQVITATIEGITTSILLEQKKKKQIFQNPMAFYEDVVQKC